MTHVGINRDYWNGMADDWIAGGEHGWAQEVPTWGIWNLPDSEVPMLPADMTGLRAIELGCGTGYVSAWMARRGAEVTGIDVSSQQLATARRLAKAHGAEITFIEGNAEATGLDSESFDFAVSEYGAAIWCDPALWLREAHRLLVPEGKLAFLGNHPLALITVPPDGAPSERVLHRRYRDMERFDWTGVEIDPGGIEFNHTIADWFALFREIGFEVLDFRELYAPLDADGQRFAQMASWAKDFPSEHMWLIKKL